MIPQEDVCISFFERCDYILKQMLGNGEIKKEELPFSIAQRIRDYGELEKVCIVEYTAKICLQNYEYYRRIFNAVHTSFLPSNLYDFGYLLYFLDKSQIYRPVIEAAYKIFRSISLKRFNKEDFEKMRYAFYSFSEYDIAELLITCDRDTAFWVISLLDVDPIFVGKLKKALKNQCQEALVELLIENEVDCSILHNACGLLKMQQICSLLLDYDYLNDHTDDYIERIIGDSSKKLPPSTHSLIVQTGSNMFSLPFDFLVSQMYSYLLWIVATTDEIKHLSIDYKAVAEYNAIMEKHRNFREKSQQVYDKAISYEIDDFIRIRDTRPILEEFKSRFIEIPKLPQSVGKAKDKYKAYNIIGKCWQISDIYYLYECLAASGFLVLDEETAFSFVYRMCPLYQPERDNPSKIVWLGSQSELWSMVRHFHPEGFKIDKLTLDFFVRPDGSPFRNGGKNSSNVKKGKMPDILQNPRFNPKKFSI